MVALSTTDPFPYWNDEATTALEHYRLSRREAVGLSRSGTGLLGCELDEDTEEYDCMNDLLITGDDGGKLGGTLAAERFKHGRQVWSFARDVIFSTDVAVDECIRKQLCSKLSCVRDLKCGFWYVEE